MTPFAPFIGVAVFYGLSFGLGWIMRRSPLVSLQADQGHSRYGGFILLTGVGGALFSVALVATLIYSDWEGTLGDDWLIGAGLAMLMAVAGIWYIRLWVVTRWVWDSTSISYLRQTLRTRLLWADISRAETVPFGWRIDGPDGTICCSHYTLGYDVISEALKMHRPDLAHVTNPRQQRA